MAEEMKGSAEKRTNSEFSKMGYAGTVKPKSMGTKKLSIRKPKMRLSIRSK
jgi:hypothetical protein